MIQKILVDNGSLDIEDKYINMLLTMIPTNQVTQRNYNKIITNNKNKNIVNVLDNMDDIIRIMVNTNVRGMWGELVVKYLLESKFNLTVTNSTLKQDLSGIDLLTSRKTHQVKTIYNYIEQHNVFSINSFIDIVGKYDYLWFFVSDTNEIIGFNHNWISISNKKFKNYNITYSDIRKYQLNNNITKQFKTEAKNILTKAGNKLLSKINECEDIKKQKQRSK